MRVVLEDEEYRELCRRVFAKQHFRCAHCGRVRPLTAHHQIPRGMGGAFRQDTEENLIGLCDRCHPEADRNRKSKFGG
jgi:5-methylcytosine-specific restriction endonuclease McrA